jgi:hypothetical protein
VKPGNLPEKLDFFVEIGNNLRDKVLPCIFLVLKWLIHSKIMKCRIQTFFTFMVGQETLKILL